MKISKLFHWLYALLMLLPAFFVGGRMAYTIFNKNAKDSYSGANGYTIEYKYNTNEVNTEDDLQIGNIYSITFPTAPTNTSTNSILKTSAVYNVKYINEQFTIDSVRNNTDYIKIRFNQNGIYFQTDNNSSIFSCSVSNIVFPFTFDFVFLATESYLDLTYTSIGTSDFNVIDNIEISNEGTLDNAFDYSMSQLNELPLFSWAKDSFIVQPFTYITGLFGMPSDSPVLTLLSYWCSISLIWLTFDLLMYVPLLVHRWLDKGVLE